MKSRLFDGKPIPELGVELVDIDDEWVCERCGKLSILHGVVDTPHGKMFVCPGKYVVRVHDDVLIVSKETYTQYFLTERIE